MDADIFSHPTLAFVGLMSHGELTVTQLSVGPHILPESAGINFLILQAYTLRCILQWMICHLAAFKYTPLTPHSQPV